MQNKEYLWTISGGIIVGLVWGSLATNAYKNSCEFDKGDDVYHVVTGDEYTIAKVLKRCRIVIVDKDGAFDVPIMQELYEKK